MFTLVNLKNINSRLLLLIFCVCFMLSAEPVLARKNRQSHNKDHNEIRSSQTRKSVGTRQKKYTKHSSPARGNKSTLRNKHHRQKGRTGNFTPKSAVVSRRRRPATGTSSREQIHPRQRKQTFSLKGHVGRRERPRHEKLSAISSPGISSRAHIRPRQRKERLSLKGHDGRRERPRQRKLSGTSSLGTSSRFTRPAREKNLFVRPTRERSQHYLRTTARPRSHISRRNNVIAHHGRGRHHRRRNFFRRLTQPRYRFAVYYRFGPLFTFRYVHPNHHRKYIFVSIGGYWPIHYTYMRYSWYGYHPYYWYGYSPSLYEVKGDTYNYYTYNYNGDGSSYQADNTGSLDESTLNDLRGKLNEQTHQEPDPVTQADEYFEDAVEAFENGDYSRAADKFENAINLAPEDMVLPFAYAQALFADQQYSKAVQVLRIALAGLDQDKKDVFYPRGLYPEDDLLFNQIALLKEKMELNPLDMDLQLLFGYQLLGTGELEKAQEPLLLATQQQSNKASAEIMLELLEKIKAGNANSSIK